MSRRAHRFGRYDDDDDNEEDDDDDDDDDDDADDDDDDDDDDGGVQKGTLLWKIAKTLLKNFDVFYCFLGCDKYSLLSCWSLHPRYWLLCWWLVIIIKQKH